MAVLLAVAAFPRSALFRVTEVTVTGASAVPPDVIIASAGIRPGQARAGVRAEAAAAGVARLPAIAAARVQVLPSGRVRIAVVERVPVAVLPHGGRYVAVDDDGVAVREQAAPGGLPVVAGPPPPWVRLGTRVPSAEVLASLEVLRRLPASVGREGLRVLAGPAGEFTLVTGDGILVKLGGRRDLADRLARLPAVLAAIRARGLAVDYVDVRFAGTVIVRPRPELPRQDSERGR